VKARASANKIENQGNFSASLSNRKVCFMCGQLQAKANNSKSTRTSGSTGDWKDKIKPINIWVLKVFQHEKVYPQPNTPQKLLSIRQ